MKKLLGLLALVGLLTALLTACGGSSDHNDADVTFAQQMVPHHEQAVEMADAALKGSKNQNVLSLAKQIKAAQDPEITMMNQWLKDWDEQTSGHGGMGGMDADDSGMGMMTDEEMTSLDDATGQEFDTSWLTLMIKHHEGAIAMARTEGKDGSNAEAMKLATAIISGQQSEITTMKGLLRS